MTYRKYSKEQLDEAVSKSSSFAGVLRELGIHQAGGAQSHIKRMIISDEIDYSHFTGQAWNKGKISQTRKTAEQLLIFGSPHDPKLKTIQLRRSLIEIGRPEKCVECGLGKFWKGKTIQLEIDHINGQPWDNRRENLRFLCPNCHSQQVTNLPWKNSKVLVSG